LWQSKFDRKFSRKEDIHSERTLKSKRKIGVESNTGRIFDWLKEKWKIESPG